MKTSNFESFHEFWPYYLSEHALRANRVAHFIGTTLLLIIAGSALATGHPLWLLYCPLAGYGFAWFGHFILERNRPATFRHPLWSLIGDFRMYAWMWRGRLWRDLPARA